MHCWCVLASSALCAPCCVDARSWPDGHGLGRSPTSRRRHGQGLLELPEKGCAVSGDVLRHRAGQSLLALSCVTFRNLLLFRRSLQVAATANHLPSSHQTLPLSSASSAPMPPSLALIKSLFCVSTRISRYIGLLANETWRSNSDL